MNNQETQNGKPEVNKKIFDYGCFLLARMRYSISDFRTKLEKKFPNQQEETNQIIELFIQRKYLDDSEYATLYIREQLRRKPQGLRMIKQKLRQKGINESTLSWAFDEQCIDESELVHQALEKKKKTLKESDPHKLKQKLYRFLASRGFHHDDIVKSLNT